MAWRPANGPYKLLKMMDFEIQKCSRRCAASDRELLPGERVYSVLLLEGSSFVRRDFSEETWSGPPDDSIGWWQARIPTPESNRVHWAPHEVMLHYFLELEATDQLDLRYVLALLMVRRRILRLESSEKPGEIEQLVLYCPSNEMEYRVPVVSPSGARVEQIQQELARLLFQ
jgi:hypothetical protein